MSESPSLMSGDGKVFNQYAVNTSTPYGPQLPNYLRRSVAMACGPPGSLPLHMKASLTAPSMSTPSKSDQSSSSREVRIRNGTIKLSADLERKINYNVLCEFLETLKSITLNELSFSEEEEDGEQKEQEQDVEEENEADKIEMVTATKASTESVQVEEAHTDQKQVTPSQKAADMLSKAILQHQPISLNDFAFLIDQIDASINLDEQSIMQMFDLLIEKNGVASEYGELVKHCLQKETRKKGGKLSFGAFRTIIAYFRNLSKKQAHLILACCSSRTRDNLMTAAQKPLPYVALVSAAVLRLLGRNPGPFTLQGSNIYLVGTGKRRILVDTGVANDADYLNDLKQLIVNSNIEIFTIICTHWHLDHTGGVKDVLKVLQNIGQPKPSVMKYSITDKSEDVNWPETLKFEYEHLRDGQEVMTTGATLRVVHTPGHTSDHVALHFLEENSLFSGDCILGHGSTAVSNMKSYMSSLNRLKGLNPVKLYPGHGPVVEDGPDRILRYIAHRNEREQAVLAALQSSHSGLTAKQIVDMIYKNLSAEFHFAAERNVLTHLRKLQDSVDMVFMSVLPHLPLRIKPKRTWKSSCAHVVRSEHLSLKAVQGNLFGLVSGFGKLAVSAGSEEPPSCSNGRLSLFLEEEIDPDEFLELSKSMRPNFSSLYAVYFHFRSKNWIVAQGTNYGVDYVLYPNLPSIVHSSYLVVLKPSPTRKSRCPLVFRNLTCYSRLATTISKVSVIYHIGKMRRVKCECLRWTFHISSWNPTASNWKHSLECIQPIEVERIGAMQCKQDVLAAVAGRLMLRKAICFGTGLSWRELTLCREPNGKPCLSGNQHIQYAFNIAHHGDFVVLAAGAYGMCGVDIMRLQIPKVRKTVGEYLELMKSNFSPNEWATFWSPNLDDSGRLRLFYRYWCLKESYLKAVGEGIHCELSRLDFQLGKFAESTHIQTDTQLRIDGRTLDDVYFEESSISDDHVACVCYSVSCLCFV
ncbi:tRNA int endo and ACPS and Lactamase B domain con taining protein [Trichuris trichiura]|uniref:Beta-lactamase-like protein 2 homolog n=1 Tax=Trichuris trichiura TaxID=36087 RepID=A0A077Z6J8_TRITR|nr:tRNA int endo and ACPS and Lactamase B domain con taining protein [Trichuris trichiura]